MGPVSLFWLCLFVFALILEAMTMGLASIWFAIGALVALLLDTLSLPLGAQIAVFLVVSAALLIATRPLVRAFLDKRKERTNADRVVGMVCRVIEPIDNTAGTGAVRVDGKDWTARAEAVGRFAPGELVKITRIGGAKVYVEPAPPEDAAVPAPDAAEGAVFEKSGADKPK